MAPGQRLVVSTGRARKQRRGRETRRLRPRGKTLRVLAGVTSDLLSPPWGMSSRGLGSEDGTDLAPGQDTSPLTT